MNQEECIRKLQSRLAQSESQLTASLATVAQLREALEKHHTWHQAQGVSYFKRDDGIMDETGIDGAEAYADSELCDLTTKALTTPAPAVVQVAKVLPVVIAIDWLLAALRQTAKDSFDAKLCGRVHDENLKPLIRALTPATKG